MVKAEDGIAVDVLLCACACQPTSLLSWFQFVTHSQSKWLEYCEEKGTETGVTSTLELRAATTLELTFRHRASCIQDWRFATLQRTLFII
jgi:hypothetical protein